MPASFPNPYKLELDSLNLDDTTFYAHPDPTPVKSLDETPFTFVDDEATLKELVAKLAGQSEIAVDLEHH